jgi:hypothetical protein
MASEDSFQAVLSSFKRRLTQKELDDFKGASDGSVWKSDRGFLE